MKISQIHLKNFRGFPNAPIEFGDYTILRGDNGAGKSSILMALAWAATGICRETHLSGAKWERLVSWGADSVGVKVVSDIATWARQRGSGRGMGGHRLQVAGVDSANVDTCQALLYERMGGNEQLLTALLDPLPIMDRDPQQQKVLISRVLKPEPVKITELMRKYSIESLASLEQIDRTVRDLKDVTLRSLNKDLKRLQDSAVERPKWPREGKTAEQLRSGHQQAQQQRDKINRELGAIERRKSDLEAAIAAGKTGGEALSEAAAANLAEAIEKLTATIARNEPLWADAEQKSKGATAERQKASEAMQKNLAEQLRVKGLITPEPVECPAKACPVLAAFADSPAAKENAEQQAKLKRLEGAYTKLDKEQKKAIQAEQDAQAAAAALAEGLRAARETLRESTLRLESHRAAATASQHEAGLAAVTAELDAAKQKLSTVQMILTKAETALEEIADYERTDQKATAYMADLEATTAGVREVKELVKQLESERTRIVESRIGAVVKAMNEFLRPFGLGPVRYELDSGFGTETWEAERWSDGERRQILEAAFRVAAAKTTGIGVAVIEHAAPLSKTRERLLAKALMGSGCQIIQVYTSDEKTAPPAGAAWRTWWVERNGTGEATATELTV